MSILPADWSVKANKLNGTEMEPFTETKKNTVKGFDTRGEF